MYCATTFFNHCVFVQSDDLCSFNDLSSIIIMMFNIFSFKNSKNMLHDRFSDLSILNIKRDISNNTNNE